jgi:hypothetical protein
VFINYSSAFLFIFDTSILVALFARIRRVAVVSSFTNVDQVRDGRAKASALKAHLFAGLRRTGGRELACDFGVLGSTTLGRAGQTPTGGRARIYLGLCGHGQTHSGEKRQEAAHGLDHESWAF